MNKTVSVIIPTCNMSGYLKETWLALEASGVLSRVLEVVFVNDGSTDSTREVLGSLKTSAFGEKLTAVHLNENKGRYLARLEGAKAARGSHLLFVDTRVEPDANFGAVMEELLGQHEALMGLPDIKIEKSVFSLYWQRTHERLFSRHYQDAKKGFFLTPKNYELYLKGTTLFLCPKDVFLAACAHFKERILHSDDTFLMREIVKTHPIWVDARWRVWWEPRQQWGPFLQRLWERGPKFAEYHVLHRKGLYFYLWLVWTLSIFLTLFYLFVSPLHGLLIIATGLSLLAASTVAFAKNPVEFIRMAPLHVGTILAYGLGAIYGVLVNLNLAKKPPPTSAVK